MKCPLPQIYVWEDHGPRDTYGSEHAKSLGLQYFNPLPVPCITYDTHCTVSNNIKKRLDRQRVNDAVS